MAASLSRLGSLALRYTRQIPSRRKLSPPVLPYRAFRTTPFHRKKEDLEDDNPKPSAPATSQGFKFDYASLDPEDKAEYDSLSPEEKLEYQQDAAEMHAHMNSPEIQSELNAEVSQLAYELSEEAPRDVELPKRIKPGLMAMGEVDEQGSGEDEEFKGDDISSLAHGELEQHREMREMARIAAWEMPLLNKFAKPFTPPALDQPLRFRYTTYMGETHPAAKKIVLEFCTKDLPLTPAQRTKLIKLVGVRYNPQTDVVKMSSEMFETQAQNKRYLGDLVDTLMTQAKDEKDTFEDVPLDFRHHKFKQKLEFPEVWKRTKPKIEVRQPARIGNA